MSEIQQERVPCLEEFVDAGYPAEDFEKRFGVPPVSDPAWKKPVELPEGLPDQLLVRSQVRNPATRTLRRQQPGRQRFKQHLFADPNRRLLRNRPVRITGAELVSHFAELEQGDATGLFGIFTLDGKRVDLKVLREGVLALQAKAPVVTQPNVRLDSIEFDRPTGIPMPQHLDGTFEGDSVAARVLADLTEEKRQEAIRQGALEDTAVETSDTPVDVAPELATVPAPEVVDFSDPNAVEDPAEQRAQIEAAAAAPRKGKKGRR